MNTLTIVNQEVQIKEWDGQRVVSFRDIDTVHQRPEGTADRNFRENRERFIEGEDFVRISKNQTDEIRGLEIPNRGITLLTESGYLMLVKSFTDDLAWQVQRALINCYFRVKAETQSKPKRVRSKPEDVVFRQQMNIAKAFANTTGISLEIAAATAINIIEERTGYSYGHWKLALPARADAKPIPSLNATAVGKAVGVAAHDANILLESAGLQKREGKNWRLTDKGKQYGEEYPYERNGHSDYRILWRNDVADEIRGAANDEF